MLIRSTKLNKTSSAWLPIISACLIFLGACSGSTPVQPSNDSEATVPPTELESRFDKVRAIHDEVMPERGRLIRLQRKVVGAELDLEITAFAKTRLERADDMMMNWMYADIPLTKLTDSLDEKSIYAYLDEREKEIQNVSDSMMTAIEFAESILAQ